VWPVGTTISLDVLSQNRVGRRFWKSIGFTNYAITLQIVRGATQSTREAVIALGSNLGDSKRLVVEAMDGLDLFAALPLRRSSLWQSSPVDCPPGSPPFVNAAVAFEPAADETPESLLAKLQALEKESGRRPKQVLNEPRPLDLDLVAFGAEVRATPELTLPHPRAHLRRFVLEPLNEIAPGLVLPGQTKPIHQLLAELRTGEVLRRIF
jgi:2-amino-4-hydroxy-6-hydroxymethyldihydropteridine diphosphokinase